MDICGVNCTNAGKIAEDEQETLQLLYSIDPGALVQSTKVQ